MKPRFEALTLVAALSSVSAAATPACTGAFVVPMLYEKTMEASLKDSPQTELDEARARYAGMFKEVQAAMDCTETCDAMAKAVERILQENQGTLLSKHYDTPSIEAPLSLSPDLIGIERFSATYRFPHQIEARLGFTQGLSGKKFKLAQVGKDATDRAIAENMEPTAEFEFTLERMRGGIGQAVVLSNNSEAYAERTCVIQNLGYTRTE